MSTYGSATPALRAAREWLIGGAAICLLGLLVALLLQHVWDMQPCAWCVLQRLIYLGVAATCIAGVILRPLRSRLSAVVIGLALALSGLWAALYQQFVASQTEVCGLTFADKVILTLQLHELAPWLFAAYAPCDRANMALIGIPFALWSAALFALLGLALSLGGRALLQSRRGLFG